MKSWIVTFIVSFAAFITQAAIINFTDNTAYPVGSDVTNHTDWALAVDPGSYAGFSGTANGIVVGSTLASQWDAVKYTGETFNVAVGSTISSSITFTFQQTAHSAAWERVLGTGARSGGGDQANLLGYISRQSNGTGDGSDTPYTIGVSQLPADESAAFTAADLGLLTGATSDTLRLTVAQTRQGANLWDTQITLTNLNSNFSITYAKSGLSFGGGDTNALNGMIVVGREDGNLNVSNRTISEFTVIPEPATLSMLGTGALLVLLIRKRIS